jgi:multicomponent Na+:H+ antiporter subunit C
MSILLALLASMLFAAGFFLILRRSMFRVVLGIGLMGNAANLSILVASGLSRGRAPVLLNEGATLSSAHVADPLPQALVLTAIVIGFGMMAFLLALVDRRAQIQLSDDGEDQ